MPIPGWISEEEQAQRLGRTVRTLRLWRQQRKGPPWASDGKYVRYREGGDEAWLESREVQPVRSRRA